MAWNFDEKKISCWMLKNIELQNVKYFCVFQDIPVVDKAGTISTRKLIRRKLDRRGQI